MGIQQKIAAELDVSIATVSRSLRNHPSISTATRARVAEAAVRLGYRPNADQTRSRNESEAPPRGLVRLCALCRGELSTGNIHNAVTLRIIDGMSAAARAQRAMIHMEFLAPGEFDSLGNAANWPPVLAEDAVSGVALFSDPGREALVALSRRFACVHLLPCRIELPIDRVTEDNAHSVNLLVEHLWALGHRCFGFVDLAAGTDVARSRFAGFVQALDDRGLVYDVRDARYLRNVDGSDVAERAERAATHIARRLKDRVRAWICTDDFVAYTLMRCLRERGVETPRDVSIVGFDNFDPPDGFPKATSIDGPFETLGRVAVSRMMQRAMDPNLPPSHTMFPARLVPGASTAAPRT